MENNISEKVLVFILQAIACLVFAGFTFIITQSAMKNRIMSGIVAILSGYILVYLIFFTEVSPAYVLIVGAVISALTLSIIYALVNMATGRNRIRVLETMNTEIIRNILILSSGITLLIGVFCLLDKEILIGVVLWFISLSFIISLSLFDGGGENE